jgi:predicted MPP superfamily phosphohydrolase
MPAVILFIGGIAAALLLAHWAVYATIVYFLPNNWPWLRWLFIVASLGFVIASIIGIRFNNWLTNVLYYLSSVWLGLFNFLFLSTILIWLLFAVGKLLNFSLPWPALLLILIGLSLVFCLYAIINANYLRVKTYEVGIPNLPASWQGRTAVWVSDTHLGPVRQAGFAQMVVDKIKVLRPDIVFVGGDLFDGTAGDLAGLAAPFSQLQPPLGVYFITGNHEEFHSAGEYLTAVKALGMRVLANESVEVDGLTIVGVNFHDGANPDRLKKIVAMIGINFSNGPVYERFKDAFSNITDKSRPSILLNHYPGNLAVASDAGINLQLSGHSHHGQIWPHNHFSSWIFHGYDYGRRQYQEMAVIVSGGAGTWGPPLRLAADPDILLIKFSN